MKTRLVCCFIVLVGCQQGDDRSPGKPSSSIGATNVTPAYAKDIGLICDAIKLSGADKDPGGQLVIVANYLAAHLATEEARKFIRDIQTIPGGDAKADAFEAEAHKVGLSSCAVAAVWRKPKAVH